MLVFHTFFEFVTIQDNGQCKIETCRNLKAQTLENLKRHVIVALIYLDVSIFVTAKQ